MRIRIPKPLIEVLNRKELKRHAVTPLEAEQLKTLFKYGATVYAKSGVLIKELEPYIIYTSAHILPTLAEVTTLYLKKSSESVTVAEHKNRVGFFNKLLPEMFVYLNIPDDLTKLKPIHLRKLSDCLKGLPNRSIGSNREKPLKALLGAPRGTSVSIITTNKLIKRIRSLLTFTSNYFGINLPSIETFKVPHNVGNREPFTLEEYLYLNETLDKTARLLLNVVYYSGLRSSEIFKASIEEQEGVWIFNLKDTPHKLKTSSSYRYVPVSSKLLPYIEDIRALTYSTIKSASRRVRINGKSLYSARHSFITQGINKGIPIHIMSELAGHQQHGMTLSNYWSGTDLMELQGYVELL